MVVHYVKREAVMIQGIVIGLIFAFVCAVVEKVLGGEKEEEKGTE